MVDDPDHGEIPHVLAAIDGLQRRIDQGLRQRAGRGGLVLRGSEGRILHLIGPDGTRPSALAEGWISKQAIGKRIQEMTERGLVIVEPDPLDGRAVVVRRTAEGDRVGRFTLDQIADLETELAEAVGPERYRVFRDVIDELAHGRRAPTPMPTPESSNGQSDGAASRSRPRGRRR